MDNRKKEALMKEASEYTGEKDAFIHCELKDGETSLIIGGQTFGVVYGCFRALERTSALTGIPFEDLIELLVGFKGCEEDRDNARER